jgi:very-short-patch-repair endonuclease
MSNKRHTPDGFLARRAARKHGLITSADLAAAGLGRPAVAHRVDVGRLHWVYRGVYSLTPRLSREAKWLAAVLAAGDGAALASLSAAFLYRLLRFEPRTIHVIAPKQRRPRPGFQLRTCRNLDPRDVTIVNAIPVTTVARTLVDLTDVLTPEEIANVIHEAAFRGLFSEPATHAAMARAPGRRLRVLEAALRLHASGSAGTRSGLEKRFLKLARAAGLAEPVKNTKVHGFEVDFRWDELCVEVDGGGHARPRSRTEDRIRDAALRAAGFTVVRFSEDDVDQRPHAVLAELAAQQLPRSATG